MQFITLKTKEDAALDAQKKQQSIEAPTAFSFKTSYQFIINELRKIARKGVMHSDKSRCAGKRKCRWKPNPDRDFLDKPANQAMNPLGS